MRRIRIREAWGWRGTITATVRHHPGIAAGCVSCQLSARSWCGTPEHQPEIVGRNTGPNLIVTSGKNWLRDALEDTDVDSGIRYMAWGSGSTAVAATDTVLDTETGRKAITSFADGATGVKVTTVYLAPTEANSSLAELGWFATSTATASVDTGVLVARVLYPGGTRVKTDQQSIEIERTDTIA